MLSKAEYLPDKEKYHIENLNPVKESNVMFGRSL